MTGSRKHPNGLLPAFTLVELLIAMAILSVLVILLASLLGGVSRAWVSSEQHVETFQDGRAILDLMSRELSQAVISSRLQLVVNPSLSDASGTAINRTNSGSIFWQAPVGQTSAGNLCEVGYYLTGNFALKRFFVPPTDATNYQVFATAPSGSSAPWITNFVQNAALSRTVSEVVIGFWVRSLDVNNEPIAWLGTDTKHLASAPLQFNSAAQFQPALLGIPASFKYTATSTLQAHLLPPTIEVTVVTLDSKTLSRSLTSIPAIPSSTDPSGVPESIRTFNQQLVDANIRTARMFSTRVRLANSLQ